MVGEIDIAQDADTMEYYKESASEQPNDMCNSSILCLDNGVHDQ